MNAWIRSAALLSVPSLLMAYGRLHAVQPERESGDQERAADIASVPGRPAPDPARPPAPRKRPESSPAAKASVRLSAPVEGSPPAQDQEEAEGSEFDRSSQALRQDLLTFMSEGLHLTPEQIQKYEESRRALDAKIHAAMKASDPDAAERKDADPSRWSRVQDILAEDREIQIALLGQRDFEELERFRRDSFITQFR